MRILGIDYGRRKIGLAVADGPLADPFTVLKVNSVEEAINKIVEVVALEKIDKVIVGISEGEMGRESKEFSISLRLRRLFRLEIPVETFDETLTTHDAQKMAIEAGMKRSKRKSLEDAFAAAVMLQAYLDSRNL